ncbi:MAG: hypothetical protein LBF27_21030 [Sphingobacterium sp.]|jgi:hypothetical protein|nr:hypothetical protein [Sphingobacterium sp.]
MKTNKGNLAKLNGRLSYEAPRVSVQTVELEQGIAAGSVDPSAKQQWGETETQTHGVTNDYWD